MFTTAIFTERFLINFSSVTSFKAPKTQGPLDTTFLTLSLSGNDRKLTHDHAQWFYQEQCTHALKSSRTRQR